jgi:hypothetical protein
MTSCPTLRMLYSKFVKGWSSCASWTRHIPSFPHPASQTGHCSSIQVVVSSVKGLTACGGVLVAIGQLRILVSVHDENLHCLYLIGTDGSMMAVHNASSGFVADAGVPFSVELMDWRICFEDLSHLVAVQTIDSVSWLVSNKALWSYLLSLIPRDSAITAVKWWFYFAENVASHVLGGSDSQIDKVLEVFDWWPP